MLGGPRLQGKEQGAERGDAHDLPQLYMVVVRRPLASAALDSGTWTSDWVSSGLAERPTPASAITSAPHISGLPCVPPCMVTEIPR